MCVSVLVGVGVCVCRRVRLVDMSFSCPVGGCEFGSVFVIVLYLACIGRRIPRRGVLVVCVCLCVYVCVCLCVCVYVCMCVFVCLCVCH